MALSKFFIQRCLAQPGLALRDAAARRRRLRRRRALIQPRCVLITESQAVAIAGREPTPAREAEILAVVDQERQAYPQIKRESPGCRGRSPLSCNRRRTSWVKRRSVLGSGRLAQCADRFALPQ